MTRDEAMKVWRDAVDAYDLAFCPGPSDAPNDAAATVIQQAFAERDGGMRDAARQVLREADELDEIGIPALKALRQALAAKGDSRG